MVKQVQQLSELALGVCFVLILWTSGSSVKTAVAQQENVEIDVLAELSFEAVKTAIEGKNEVADDLPEVDGIPRCKISKIEKALSEKRKGRFKEKFMRTKEEYEVHPFTAPTIHGRKLSQQETDALYKPLRIVPYFDFIDDDRSANATLLAYVRDRLVPEAVEKWSQLLSVVPVSGNLQTSRSCDSQWNTEPAVCFSVQTQEKCFDSVIPKSHFKDTRVCSNCVGDGCNAPSSTCSIVAGGDGVAQADLVIYVQALSTSYCEGGTLAYALPCQLDQFDRPSHGYINFCPEHLSTDAKDHVDQVTTAVHEIAHVLGFTEDLYSYMRTPEGTPRSPRGADGNPIYDTVDCVNGETLEYYRAGNNVIQMFTERGAKVSKMVTPKVLAYARFHFNCPTLNGVELESKDASCYGSHWEERLFQSETMSPAASHLNVLSGLTLAFFEDMGHYRANYSLAEPYFWGRDQGCAFAQEKCIERGASQEINHYCSTSLSSGCSDDHSAWGFCYVHDYDTPLPVAYQYFSNPNSGGSSSYADFCPTYYLSSSYTCNDASNLRTVPKNSLYNLSVYGEAFGPTSKCAHSTLHLKDATAYVPGKTSGCFAMECASNGTLIISIPSQTQAHPILCEEKGELKTVTGYTGFLTCPDPAIVCHNNSCSDDCGVRNDGVCITGKCVDFSSLPSGLPLRTTTGPPTPSPDFDSSDVDTSNQSTFAPTPWMLLITSIGLLLLYKQ